MKAIAMYDITGIQKFIFASSKVKENIGASILVQKIFADLQGEVIYDGGGNVMVRYTDKRTAVEATQKLSLKMLTQTAGSLKFAVAYKETECTDFLNDQKELIQQLTIHKYKRLPSTPLLGIGITREGVTDGLPASVEINNQNNSDEYLSKSAHGKRETWADNSGYFDDLLPNTGDYQFPLEFDDLGQQVGENYIAIVHIDGNNTGKILDRLLTGAPYEESIQIIGQFSTTLKTTYASVMKHVVQNLVERLKDEEFCNKLKPVIKGRDYFLPIRPIVLNGDDVTFVCNGKIGIALAEAFLTELDKNSRIRIDGKDITLSACAGVAIVKSHFPFYRAYQLADELCRSAKLKGKTLAAINGVEEIGNWLDFHIVQTGITTNLNEIREKLYQVPGMTPPEELAYKLHGSVLMKVKLYNLLWRPWCVTGNFEEKYQWKTFKNIYTGFTTKKENQPPWKRSRLKKLESEMTQSKLNADAYIRECNSRGLKLPECLKSVDLYRGGQTPYFDALELLDFYVQLEETPS